MRKWKGLDFASPHLSFLKYTRREDGSNGYKLQFSQTVTFIKLNPFFHFFNAHQHPPFQTYSPRNNSACLANASHIAIHDLTSRGKNRRQRADWRFMIACVEMRRPTLRITQPVRRIEMTCHFPPSNLFASLHLTPSSISSPPLRPPPIPFPTSPTKAPKPSPRLPPPQTVTPTPPKPP